MKRITDVGRQMLQGTNIQHFSSTSKPSLNKASIYPTDFIHGVLSLHTYQKKLVGKVKPETKVTFDDQHYKHYNSYVNNWVIKNIASDPKTGFLSVTYFNKDNKQVVLGYKGTSPEWASLVKTDSDIKADINGILKGIIIPQQEQTFAATKAALELAKKNDSSLSITGHSLGAWLAEQSLYFCNTDFKHYKKFYVKAVTFDSPGSKRTMEDTFKLNQRNEEQLRLSDIDNLDIVTYLSDPNCINICNGHVGKIYRVFPELEKTHIERLAKMLVENNWIPDAIRQVGGDENIIIDKVIKLLENKFLLHSLSSFSSHKLDNILKTFSPKEGKPEQYEEVKEWPILEIKDKNNSSFIATIKKYVQEKLGISSQVVLDYTESATLSSTLSVLHNVYTGRIASKQFVSTCEHFDKNLSQDGKIDNLFDNDSFALKYKSHYSTTSIDMHSDQLNTKKYISDYFLKKIKLELDFKDYGYQDDLIIALKDMVKEYNIDRATNVITTNNYTVDNLREFVLYLLFRMYPNERQHLEDVLNKNISSADNQYHGLDYLAHKNHRQNEIKKLVANKKSIHDILDHFYKMSPHQKLKFFGSSIKEETSNISILDKLKQGVKLESISKKSIDNELIPDVIEILIENGNAQVAKYMTNEYHNKEHIIVMGNTGVGKSTFVNYITNAKLRISKESANETLDSENFYTVHKTVIGLSADDTDYSNRPKIGLGRSSETTIPNVYEDANSNVVYWDCPGLEDNKGSEQEIINNFYAHELFKNLKNIKLVILCPASLLNQDQDKSVCTKFIARLTEIFDSDVEKLKESIFVITKSNDEDINGKCVGNMIGLVKDFSIQLTETQRGALQALIDCKNNNTMVFLKSYESLSQDANGIITDIQARNDITDIIKNASCIELKHNISGVGANAREASTILFKNFEDKLQKMMPEAIKLLENKLQNNQDIEKVLSFCTWIIKPRTTENEQKEFLQNIEIKLVELGVNFDDFKFLNHIIKYLEFFSAINPINKVNYNLLNFNGVENIIIQKSNFIKDQKQREVNDLLNAFITKFKDNISKYKNIEKNKAEESKKAIVKLKAIHDSIKNSFSLKVINNDLAKDYDEINKIDKLINELGKHAILNKKDIHSDLRDHIVKFIYDRGTAVVQEVIDELSLTASRKTELLQLKKYYRDVITNYTDNKFPNKGFIEKKYDSNKVVFKASVIKFSEIKKLLDEYKIKYKIGTPDMYIFGYDAVDFDHFDYVDKTTGAKTIDLKAYGNIAIVAPKWIINEPITLNLRGMERQNFDTRAQDGNYKNMDAAHGQPGKPGNPGKNFLGVVDLDRVNQLDKKENNLSGLTIDVRGGPGQKGQDGGNGKDADK